MQFLVVHDNDEMEEGIIDGLTDAHHEWASIMAA